MKKQSFHHSPFLTPFSEVVLCFYDWQKHRAFFVLPRHILYAKSLGKHIVELNYLNFMQKPLKHICTMNMKKAEEFLATKGPFMQVHRQWIINLHRICEFNIADYTLMLDDETIVPVSQFHKKELFDAAIQFKCR